MAKPSMLEAQMMSWPMLFQRCAIDMTARSKKLALWFGGIIAACLFLYNFGTAIWQAVTKFFHWFIALLHLEKLVEIFWLLYHYLIYLPLMAYMSAIQATHQWAVQHVPWATYTFTVCRNEVVQAATENTQAAVTQICDGATQHNYVGMAVGGVLVAAPVLLLAVTVLAILRVLFWGADRDDIKSLYRQTFMQTLPLLVAFVFATALFGWLVHILVMPVILFLTQAGQVYQVYLMLTIIISALVFTIPVLVLEMRMVRNIGVARQEQKMELYDPSGKAGEKVDELFHEEFWMPLRRGGLVLLGALAFLSMVAYGSSIWPSWLGVAGTALVAGIIVVVALVCVITCYPNLKTQRLRLLQIYEDMRREEVQEYDRRRLESRRQGWALAGPKGYLP